MLRFAPFWKRFSLKRNKFKIFIGVTVLLLAVLLVFSILSKKDEEQPYKRYETLVSEFCNKYGLSRALVLSVIECESGFNETAVSEAGASGLMQLMPETFEWVMSNIAEEKDIFNASQNIEAGCKYLAYLFRRFGVLETVLAAYNAGEGNVSEWLKNPQYSDDGRTLRQIPFQETRFYVSKVLRRAEYFENVFK